MTVYYKMGIIIAFLCDSILQDGNNYRLIVQCNGLYYIELLNLYNEYIFSIKTLLVLIFQSLGRVSSPLKYEKETGHLILIYDTDQKCNKNNNKNITSKIIFICQPGPSLVSRCLIADQFSRETAMYSISYL